MEVIKLSNIQVVDSVEDWSQSLNLSANLLLEGGYIEQSYIDAIFESTEKNGPYYVLAPEIAMPHASARDGVNESQISLLVVKEAFKFSEEGFDVRLVFTLASKDSTSHLGYLQVLSNLFSDDALVQKLAESNSAEEAYRLLNDLKEEE